MSKFCGVCGFSGNREACISSLKKTLVSLTNFESSQLITLAGTHWAISIAPVDNSLSYFLYDNVVVVVDGNLYSDSFNTRGSIAEEIFNQFKKYGLDFLKSVKGVFSLVIIDNNNLETVLAIDSMGIAPMSYAGTKHSLYFSNSVDLIHSNPNVTTSIDPQAIYNYLYFSTVPSPNTIYHQISKLEPSQFLVFQKGSIRQKDYYWRPEFAKKTSGKSINELGEELTDILKRSVARNNPEGNAGAFLSGGLDSSTVCGVMSTLGSFKTKSYSIGFSAEGYDETGYARIAAKHYNLDSHEYYVTPQDVADTVPLISKFYDEPFGNSSALPAYYCAKMAKNDGTDILLAGDGGDEIFAGNQRYAKQKLFEYYFNIPGFVRKTVIEPSVFFIPLIGRLKSVRKIRSYIDQANVPLPDRLENYNFLHMSNLSEIFDPDFLANIDSNLPLNMQRSVYNRCTNNSTLDKMLFLDWKFTLADNDIRKVNGMCAASGVAVGYPMLDRELVEFSATVPDNLKLRRLDLRYFFKQALSDFLPDEILNKPKHGFGLPFGVWLKDYDPLQDILHDSLKTFKARSYINPSYIDWLLDRHQKEHAGFFGSMLWMLMILELWLREHT